MRGAPIVSHAVTEDFETEYDPEDPAADEIDPGFYTSGGIVLSDPELELLGDIQDLKVLNLQPGTGEEALSFANLGAEVTVIDDEHSLADAIALAAEAAITLNFFDADVNALPSKFRRGEFDLVYSGFGGIDWLTDIDGWAEGIAESLKPGGRLLIYDEHPFSYTVEADEGQLVVTSSYFGDSDSLDAMSYPGEEYDVDEEAADVEEDESDEDGSDEDNEESSFSWTLGDLISALGGHGLATISMREYQTSDRFETPLDRFYDELDDESIGKLPSAFLLLAVKLPTAPGR